MSIAAAPGHDRPAGVVIRPSRGWRALDFAELWRNRELLYFLVWRDIKVRYKQTALGAAWALLQPLVAMAVFTLFLGRFLGVPSDGVPYPLFVYAGLLPWTYFANAVTTAGGSMVSNANLISKVYFPRLIVPLAAVTIGLVDLAIGLALLMPLMLAWGVVPGPRMLLVLPFIALAVLTAFGAGLWLCTLDVRYRDVRHAVPFLVQVWMFATPVVYPASIVPEGLRVLYGLNPMVGVVEGMRWAVFGHAAPLPGMVAVSTLVVLFLVAGGLLYFRRVEGSFSDVI